jgi:hypothetical protein
MIKITWQDIRDALKEIRKKGWLKDDKDKKEKVNFT